MAKRPTRWSEAERFAFTTQRLRASTIPNKKAVAKKKACRNWRTEQ